MPEINIIRDYDTFSSAYSNLLYKIYNNPEFETSPRGMSIKEDLNVMFILNNPKSNLYINKVRSSPVSYICDELIWYLQGDTSPTWIGKRASLWNRITNPDGTVNSNYGNLILYETDPSQFQWAYESLVGDKDSRQALMNYNGIANCHFFGVKDFTCTLSSIFHIRDNKLHMTTTMRSNDIIFGLPADIVWFTIVHQQMFKHLQKEYFNLELGTYTHIAHSLHLYEKHFTLAEKMLGEDFDEDQLPPLMEDLWDKVGNISPAIYYMICKAVAGDTDQILSKDKLINFIYNNATRITNDNK
jgi:thymidylate synthase